MLITAFANRHRSFLISICDTSGALVPVTASDIVYLKIGRNRETPVFELSSETATAAGSSMTKANPTEVILKRADLATIAPGTYDIEVGFLDASDSDEMKHATEGVFVLHGMQAGDDERSEF